MIEIEDHRRWSTTGYALLVSASTWQHERWPVVSEQKVRSTKPFFLSSKRKTKKKRKKKRAFGYGFGFVWVLLKALLVIVQTVNVLSCLSTLNVLLDITQSATPTPRPIFFSRPHYSHSLSLSLSLSLYIYNYKIINTYTYIKAADVLSDTPINCTPWPWPQKDH